MELGRTASAGLRTAGAAAYAAVLRGGGYLNLGQLAGEAKVHGHGRARQGRARGQRRGRGREQLRAAYWWRPAVLLERQMENKRCGGIAASGLARRQRTNERAEAPAAISCKPARAFFVRSLAGGQQRASSPSPAARHSRSHLQDASQPSPRRPQLSALHTAHCSPHPALAAIVGCRGTEARSLIPSWCFSASQAKLTPGRTSLLQHSAPSILRPSTPVVRCCPFAPAIAPVVRASVAVVSPGLVLAAQPTLRVRIAAPLDCPVAARPRDNTPPPRRRLLAAA
jgi:hypothetical protein